MRKEKLNELQDYIKELGLKKKKVLDENGEFLTIERYLCELNNGEIVSREKVLKKKKDGNACVILPITEDGEVLLIVQPRVFTESGVCVEAPAGYLEDNEDYLEAGLRELLEETGYVPEKITYLAGYYQDQGCSGAYNKCFLAEGCHRVTNQHLDKGEFIKCFECSFDEALELVDMGMISDVSSQLALERAKQYVKKNDPKE